MRSFWELLYCTDPRTCTHLRWRSWRARRHSLTHFVDQLNLRFSKKTVSDVARPDGHRHDDMAGRPLIHLQEAALREANVKPLMLEALQGFTLVKLEWIKKYIKNIQMSQCSGRWFGNWVAQRGAWKLPLVEREHLSISRKTFAKRSRSPGVESSASKTLFAVCKGQET